ncbi:ribosome biogenesis protein ytm1 [Coemansia sp. RSA 552]|nr:ribosome biogenesis protein ytm1 [Coemansia sp. RSA 552]
MDSLVSRVESGQALEGVMELDAARAAELSTALGQRLAARTAALRQRVGDNYQTYAEAVAAANAAQEASAQLLRGVAAAEAILGEKEESGVRQQVLKAQERAGLARDQVQHSAAVVDQLRQLSALAQKLGDVDRADRDDVDAMAHRVADVRDALEVAELDGTRIGRALADAVDAARTRVTERAAEILCQRIAIASDPDQGWISISSNDGGGASVLDALDILGTADRARAVLSAHVIAGIVRPVLECAGVRSTTGSGNSLVIEFGPKDSTQVGGVCGAVQGIVSFVDVMCGDSGWTAAARTDVVALVAQRFVVRRAPTTRDARAAFAPDAEVLAAFEQRILECEGPIADVLGRLDELGASRRRGQALSDVRRLVSGRAIFATREAEPPHGTVSQAVYDAVARARELAEDEGDAESARLVVDVFGALVPALHGSELRRVPALAWQFHNDALYAAQFCTRFDGDAWLRSARQLVAAGTRCAAERSRADTRELCELVDSSAFSAASSPRQEAALGAMARRVRLMAGQLARTLRPLVTPHVFGQTMAAHVSAVFGAHIDAILGLGDIGADDSQVLSDHCRDILSLSELAAAEPGGPDKASDPLLASGPSEPPNVPLYGRLAQLADVLVLSRADILARRRAGLLRGFSADELAALVRALFAETRDRERDIATLYQ